MEMAKNTRAVASQRSIRRVSSGSGGDAKSPGISIPLSARVQFSQSPQGWRLCCILLNRKSLGTSQRTLPANAVSRT